MLPSEPNTNPSTSSELPSPTPSGPAGIESGASVITAEMEAEIDAAMKGFMPAPASSEKRTGGDSQAQGIAPRGGAKPAALRGPRVIQGGREHRHGKIVSVGPTDIFIEFGPKELGVVPRLQWGEGETPPGVGEEVAVVVDKFEAGEGLFICSRPGAVQKAKWEFLEPGQTVEARVTAVVKGGIELEVVEHRAFMPASQIAMDRIEDLSVFVGQKMTCRVVRVDRAGKGNILLSRRDLLEEERRSQATKLKESLQEGQTLEGTVRKIMPFGAFVDLGGVDGLVHLNDLTYDRVGFGEKAVAKHIQEGQRVTVKVLKIDWDNNRISLGVKQVMGDPFASAGDKLKEGEDVTGRVTKILEFGAFVEIAPGVEGLVHISELDHKRVMKVDDVVKPDEVVTVRILKIDQGQRRISLSIKACKPLPEVTLGGGEGQGGGQGGRGGKPGGKKGPAGRTAEEILKETPALRRMREKFKNAQFKGGLS
ncbi:MAG: S1 RNA-binding domain-containing protein [Planctomycetota bacterium]|nr:S1 RNA-binding domain-containing protein [Planctomycetota bacterium]